MTYIRDKRDISTLTRQTLIIYGTCPQINFYTTPYHLYILRHLNKVLNGITPVFPQGLSHGRLCVMEMILNDVFQCDVVMIFQRVQIYFLRVTDWGIFQILTDRNILVKNSQGKQLISFNISHMYDKETDI